MFLNVRRLECVAPKTVKDCLGPLWGKALSQELIDQASETAAGEASPVTDIRASKEYRKEMVRISTRRVPKGRA